MRKSTLVLIYLTLNIVLLFLMFAHASYQRKADAGILAEKMSMERELLQSSPYILDFYCPTAKVAVELDGGLHNQNVSRK